MHAAVAVDVFAYDVPLFPRGPPFGKSIDKESRQMVTMSSFGKPGFFLDVPHRPVQ